MGCAGGKKSRSHSWRNDDSDCNGNGNFNSSDADQTDRARIIADSESTGVELLVPALADAIVTTTTAATA
jgi:hypothetical protein